MFVHILFVPVASINIPWIYCLTELFEACCHRISLAKAIIVRVVKKKKKFKEMHPSKIDLVKLFITSGDKWHCHFKVTNIGQ